MVHSFIVKKIAKACVKPVGRILGKKAGKKLSKKVPFLGAVASAGWFVFDVCTGDFIGAAFDAADFVGNVIPPVGIASTALETACDTKDAIKASATISYQIANTGAQIAYAAADGAKTAATFAGTVKDGISMARDGKTLLSTAKDVTSVMKDVF